MGVVAKIGVLSAKMGVINEKVGVVSSKKFPHASARGLSLYFIYKSWHLWAS